MGSNLIDIWVRVYNGSPKIFIPGTKFDVCFTILSTLCLSVVRALSTFIYIRIFNFDPTNRRTLEMAASTTSAIHSLLLVPVLWQLLRDQPFVPSAPIANAPQRYKDGVTAMLQLCTGYMIYDFIFMMKLEGWTIHADDLAFVAHHFVTIFVMTQTRILGAGHVFTMNLMWSGEWTNPLQNLLYVTKYAIQMTPDDSFVHMIHPYVEMAYALFYLFFRAVVGPGLIVINTFDLLFTKEGRKNIPFKVSLLWCPMTAGIIIGSIPWTIEAYDMIMDGLGNVKYHKDFDYGPRFGGL
jgi:hypothetical protein